jgi:hypothetical protein
MLERWTRLEPVRTYLYPVVTAVVLLLLGRGLIGDTDASLILTLAGLILGVGGVAGVETARNLVTPIVKLGDVGQVLRRQGDELG